MLKARIFDQNIRCSFLSDQQTLPRRNKTNSLAQSGFAAMTQRFKCKHSMTLGKFCATTGQCDPDRAVGQVRG